MLRRTRPAAPAHLHWAGAAAHIGRVDSPQQPWAIVERGSFVFAQCVDCGWLSPARRAYASAHKEGEKHVEVCAGPVSPDPTDGQPT